MIGGIAHFMGSLNGGFLNGQQGFGFPSFAGGSVHLFLQAFEYVFVAEV